MKSSTRFESFQAMQDRCHAAEVAIENLHAEMTLAVSYLAPVALNSPTYNDAVCQDAISDLLKDEVSNWLEVCDTVRVPFQSADSSDTDLGITSFVL